MPRSRTQAERRASSERRLLNATAVVIAQRGTGSVSFADIAKEAGCSHGLPGYLFGSKADLLLALVDDVFRELRAHTVDVVRPREQGLGATLSALRRFLNLLARPTPYTRAMYVLLGEAPGAPPELQKALRAYQESVRDLFREAVAEGIEAGEIRPEIDPDAQAVVLLGMARGIGQQVVLHPGSVDLDAVAVEVLSMVTRALAVDGWVPPDAPDEESMPSSSAGDGHG